MRNTHAKRTTWLVIGGSVLALAAASACAPKAARRQTDVMEKSGKVDVSAADLRARVNDLADSFVGRLEESADRISAETRDRTVRRRALTFKIDAVPAVYTAAYRSDPLAAAVDVWALAFQIDEYLEEGAGRDAFGSEQGLARKAVRDVLADADTLIQGVVTRPEHFVSTRAQVEDWVRTHPIEHTLSSRPSIVGFAAKQRSENRDAFVAVGTVSDTLENLSERLNTYAAQLPKQARWQAELLVSDMVGEHDVEGALGDIGAVGAAARRANDLLGEAGPPVREMLAAERRAVLEGVNHQRLETLSFVTAERVATLVAFREERIALAAALRQERIETLKEVDAIKTRGVEAAVAGLRDIVDYAFWRVAVLFFLLMLSTATLGVVGYWLTVGRRAPR